MSVPTVSVTLLAYNHEKYVAEAIQSILDQTFTDFELVIKEKNAVITCAELPTMECIPLQMNQLFCHQW